MGARMRRRRRSVARPGWMIMMMGVVVIMMIMNRKMTVMIMLAIMTKNGDGNDRSTPSAENSDRNMASMLCVR